MIGRNGPDLTRVAEDLREVSASAMRIATVLLCPFTLLPGNTSTSDSQNRQQRLSAVVWRLDRAFASVTHDPRALEEGVRDLVDAVNEFRPEVLAWIEFVETLCHEVEGVYGTAPGRGEFKRLQVQAALLYYIRRSRLDIPQVPEYLEPIVLQLWGGAISEQIVMLADRFRLWADSGPAQPPPRRRMQVAILGRLTGMFHGISAGFANFAWGLALRQNPLQPAIKQAIDRVQVASEQASTVPALLTWPIKYRAQVAAVVEIVGIATGEAERFAGLSGPEKRAYAHDLIFVLLERNGWPVDDPGILQVVAEGLVDLFIDAVVSIFNKRGYFQHGSAALQSAGVRERADG